MYKSQTIIHEGVVRTVRTHEVVVAVMQSSACSGCAAARLCRSSESRERLIDVAVPDASDFCAGQRVTLMAASAQSRMAVVLAYVVPLVLLLAALFAVHALTGNDGLAALVALCVTAAYYGVLYLLRSRLSRSFSFTITPLTP